MLNKRYSVVDINFNACTSCPVVNLSVVMGIPALFTVLMSNKCGQECKINTFTNNFMIQLQRCSTTHIPSKEYMLLARDCGWSEP